MLTLLSTVKTCLGLDQSDTTDDVLLPQVQAVLTHYARWIN